MTKGGLQSYQHCAYPCLEDPRDQDAARPLDCEVMSIRAPSISLTVLTGVLAPLCAIAHVTFLAHFLRGLGVEVLGTFYMGTQDATQYASAEYGLYVESQAAREGAQ